jgi:uncharacterized protein DUF4159
MGRPLFVARGDRAAALRLWLLVALAAFTGPHLAHAQQPWREYENFEGHDAADVLPPDYQVPAELVLGRLMYPSSRGFGFRGRGDWRNGGSWTVDYPAGDRELAEMLRRFTRVDVRSVEQPVDAADDGDIYYWPFLMVGLAGYWQLDDERVDAIREYLLRGGFLFCDSFFDSYSWEGFEDGLKRIFPDRPIIDLTDDHPVFHSVYDLPAMTKVQIPNMNSLMGGGGGWLGDGYTPHWRGIEDDDGRLMVLIAFNNDVSDSWQWADDPRYPGELANLGLRIGVNIAMYTMTH